MQIPFLSRFSEQFSSSYLNYKIGNIEFSPSYLQAASIMVLLFLLILTLARIRYLYVHWNLGRSAMAMLVWGFLLAIIVEGFLILGGRTLFTEILGWEDAPKPIAKLLTISRNKLVDVLGVTEEVPSSFAKKSPTSSDILDVYLQLSSEEAEKVKDLICQ